MDYAQTLVLFFLAVCGAGAVWWLRKKFNHLGRLINKETIKVSARLEKLESKVVDKNIYVRVIERLKVLEGHVGDNLPLADVLDWERWLPFANDDIHIKAFFDFMQLEKAKDSNGKRIRFFLLSGLVEELARRGQLQADVAECGCYMGHSSFLIASVLKHCDFDGRFHIFDSFEGLSDPVEEDLAPIAKGPDRAEIARQMNPKDGKRRFRCSLERVRRNLKEFDFISYYPGWIPTRFDEVAAKKFSFVNIDVDLYEPTIDCLNFFYPRLIPGGMMFVDDYGVSSWPGSARAVEKWLIDNPTALALKIPLGGLVIVKQTAATADVIQFESDNIVRTTGS